MSSIFNLFSTEPTVAWGAIGALVTTLIALGVAFGLHLTEEQTTAINAVVAALGTLVTLLVIRSQVSPAAPTPAPAASVAPAPPNVS